MPSQLLLCGLGAAGVDMLGWGRALGGQPCGVHVLVVSPPSARGPPVPLGSGPCPLVRADAASTSPVQPSLLSRRQLRPPDRGRGCGHILAGSAQRCLGNVRTAAPLRPACRHDLTVAWEDSLPRA